ncbi:MAG TPA: hypothetical protein VGQ57_06510 [Polyangiaceae bacterium]|nr:hypothetical protein [Polyangiaceae bacterium]
MKTTVEIAEPLLARARSHARRTGRPLRALIEEGLRLVLQTERGRTQHRLSDLSVGDPGGPNPLDKLSWQDLRDEIYGGR